MATNVNYNSVTYSVPAEGDDGWGSSLSSYLIALATGSLQKSGGTFTLTSEVNFGATYGLKSAYYKSLASNPASAGILRLGNAENVSWRNNANSSDLSLSVNSSDQLLFNGVQIKTSGSIVNADIDAAAAIAYSKLAALTASRLLVSDVSGVVSVSSVTATEAGYLSGVTSAIQTQINAKAPAASPTFTGTITTPLTASRAMVTGASSELAVSATTATELGYVSGVTSSIQTQLNTKVISSAAAITSALTMDEIAAPSTPASGKFAIYPKSDGKLYTLNDAGTETEVGAGGSSGINYIDNPDFESDASGWSITKNTSANAIPDNGFSTSSLSNSIARSTSSPLRGTASGLYTLAALGNQLVRGFTIDSADKYKVLQGSFDYSIASGTYADDTVTVWIYDIANDNFIQPAPYLLKNHSLPSERMFFEFQCTDSTSYYLVLHQAAASTAAVKIDNFIVGPQAKLYGSAVTDWNTSWTPTGSWTSNTTYTGAWKKVGDDSKYQVKVSLSGAPTSATLTINLPSGHSVDTTKLKNTSGSARIGTAALEDSGLGYYTVGEVYYNGSSSVVVSFGFNNSFSGTTYTRARADVNATTPITFASGDVLDIKFEVPIVGWSSSQIMSQDASTRVIDFAVTGPNALTTTGATIVWATTTKDAVGGYNASTGEYTIKTPGDYEFSAGARCASTAMTIGHGTLLILYKNGSIYKYIASVRTQVASAFARELISAPILAPDCVTGDVFKINLVSDTSVALDHAIGNSFFWFSGRKLQGPAQIAASETVVASYRISADKTPSVSNPIDFDTKIFDSHNAVTTGSSWKFTAPMSGTYQVSNTNATSTTGGTLDLYVNGSQDRGLMSMADTSVRSSSSTVKLLAGGYVDIRCDTAAKTFSGTKNNTIYITRIGNY